MRAWILFIFASLFSAAAVAGFRLDPVSVHPANPQIGKPILVLVRYAWSDGCLGTLDVRVNPSRIDIIQIPNNVPSNVCTQALVPYEEIFNPQDYLDANARFENQVEVRFFRRNFDLTEELLDTDTVRFGSIAPQSSAIPSGSFSTQSIGYSGLFVDQQEDLFSAVLSDYDQQGRGSWRYAAGKMHGDVYLGDLSSYHQVQCVQAPCPRAVPDSTGRINIVVLNPNEMVVSYRNALAGDVPSNSTHFYTRLIFNRADSLPGPDSGYAWLPDLVGEWLVGVTGTNQENPEFKRYRISYSGIDVINPMNRNFNVRSAINESDSFRIVCSDDRPVDGEINCNIDTFQSLTRRCSARFSPTDVTHGNARFPATCDSLETEFILQRLGR